MTLNKEGNSKLFDNISHTTSKIGQLIDRVKGYRKGETEEELNLEDNSRWDNLKTRLSGNGDFQPAEDSQIKKVEEKLGPQFDQNDKES